MSSFSSVQKVLLVIHESILESGLGFEVGEEEEYDEGGGGGKFVVGENVFRVGFENACWALVWKRWEEN